MSKHTPEPWANEDGLEIITTVEQSDCFVAFPIIAECKDDQNIGTDRAFENAERIVACVNACAGIPDPEKTVPEMIEFIRSLSCMQKKDFEKNWQRIGDDASWILAKLETK